VRKLGQVVWVAAGVLDSALDVAEAMVPGFSRSRLDVWATRVCFRWVAAAVALGYDGRCGAHERGEA
jgi:hypothetical protein